MTVLRACRSGLAGAAALTLLHEAARRLIPNAPRVDVIGMRAIAQAMRGADQEPPARHDLFRLALLGDLVSNSLYYSLVALGKREKVWATGLLLGLVAGVGAALLSAPLGLGRQPGERFPRTHLLTVLWYTVGGLVAAWTYQAAGASLED